MKGKYLELDLYLLSGEGEVPGAEAGEGRPVGEAGGGVWGRGHRGHTQQWGTQAGGCRPTRSDRVQKCSLVDLSLSINSTNVPKVFFSIGEYIKLTFSFF